MLARILWFLGAAVILVLAFFFVAVALIAGLILGAGLLARVWWVSRRIKKAAEQQIISTEYAVIERELAHEPPRLAETSDRQRESGPRSHEPRPGPETDATAPGIPPARK